MQIQPCLLSTCLDLVRLVNRVGCASVFICRCSKNEARNLSLRIPVHPIGRGSAFSWGCSVALGPSSADNATLLKKRLPHISFASMLEL